MASSFDPLDFSDCTDTDMPIPDFTGSSDEDDGYVGTSAASHSSFPCGNDEFGDASTPGWVGMILGVELREGTCYSADAALELCRSLKCSEVLLWIEAREIDDDAINTKKMIRPTANLHNQQTDAAKKESCIIVSCIIESTSVQNSVLDIVMSHPDVYRVQQWVSAPCPIPITKFSLSDLTVDATAMDNSQHGPRTHCHRCNEQHVQQILLKYIEDTIILFSCNLGHVCLSAHPLSVVLCC
eukprot:m.1270799 g.1270799  ORF g.1270799 m.1270799 type:complete len:241 (+) comp24749_c0_seq59:72-794(+)